MTEHKITLAAGATKVLHTAGMYCDRDIVVTADGGGKREGTAIPVGEVVDRIYFNTNNTREETMAILSQLTFIETPLYPSPIYLIYVNTADGNLGSFMLVAKTGGGDDVNFEIIEARDITSEILTSYFWSGMDGTINGWNLCPSEVTYNIPVLFSGVKLVDFGAALSDFGGIPVGTENEKIKNVLSITPF